MSRLAASVVACALAACAPPPPTNAVLGVAGVARAPGSLAGAFATKTVAVDIVQSPIGEVEAAGATYALALRVWDGAVYSTTITPCSTESTETGGLLVTTPDETARAVPAMTVVAHVDHEAGTFEQAPAVELWALREDGALDDENVWDMDDDGHPGATAFASGLVGGEIRFAQRKSVSWAGVLTEDGAMGTAAVARRSRTLDATNELLLGSAERAPHPDPLSSWFVEVPLDEGADCDDVAAARDDGRVPRMRPF